ncbi:MAG: uracil-DNA glycosylase [Gammaproteobacteria bacterium]|nr:MAG: uracil-DNA glycosylase [Gammaproteobacteria bacterium]
MNHSQQGTGWEHTGLLWRDVLADVKQSQSFRHVTRFVAQQRQTGHVIYPPAEQVFNAFKKTEFCQVKVVILGQDPYHGKGQANGLAFSVNKGIAIPPSLINIYKEIADDIGATPPPHGDLSHWADQGVLLLNTVLTVQANRANSHRKQGWEEFTDAVIRSLNQAPQHIVFLLWGKPAQSKVPLIDTRHSIFTAPHPSPLSAYRGFFGCQHFSKTNQALIQHWQDPIRWV